VRRLAPRPLGPALERLSASWAPATPLAAVQRVWPDVAGPAVAREAHPLAERAGVVTVGCSSAVWAHELDLLGPALVEALNRALGGTPVRRLRCVTGHAGRGA
jgi:predicted nucleic acid-binding Zn ribbon protein